MQCAEIDLAGGRKAGQVPELSKGPQSTGRLLLIEPAAFRANPETMDTNVYQASETETPDVIFSKALAEFRAFRDMLVENRVAVTTVKGVEGCPDHLFPNWISTHTGGRMIVYPMRNDNRRAERSRDMMSFFGGLYETAHDLTPFEKQEQFLESTGSLCLDRVNRVAYATLSGRTTESLARLWGDLTGYEVVIFETQSHAGKPVYHTDLVMWIGTEVAAVCAESIREDRRDAVLARLRKTHEVIELGMDHLRAFCGNALEILDAGGNRMLVMSEGAWQALDDGLKDRYGRFFDKIIHAPIPTIEKYGGGSARCLIMELF